MIQACGLFLTDIPFQEQREHRLWLCYTDLISVMKKSFIFVTKKTLEKVETYVSLNVKVLLQLEQFL